MKAYQDSPTVAFNTDFQQITDLYKKMCTTASFERMLLFPYAPLPFSPLYENACKMGFKPPKTIQKWARYELTDIHVPWIKPNNYSIIKMFNYSSFIASVDFSFLYKSVPRYVALLLKPIMTLFRLIGKFRLNFRFFSYPIDEYIFNKSSALFFDINRNSRLSPLVSLLRLLMIRAN